jgi:hypothetical protein
MESPSLDQWRELYRLADALRHLAPWQWMTEEDLWGLQDPVTNEIHFVNVMGAAGEHLAVAAYPGRRGLRFYRTIQEDTDSTNREFAEIMFSHPQMQLSLEDRDRLAPHSRGVIKKLGIKYRGRQTWPQFLSYRPGYYPGPLDAEEGRLMRLILEQGLSLWPRCRENPHLLSLPTDQYLVRVTAGSTDVPEWRDEVKVVLPSDASLSVPSPVPSPEWFRDLDRRPSTLELDVRMMLHTPVAEENERPHFPFLFLLAEAGSGLVLATHMLRPVPSLEKMWSDVPEKVGQALKTIGFLPSEIVVATDLLMGLLYPLALQADVKLRRAERLPAIETMLKQMPQFS